MSTVSLTMAKTRHPFMDCKSRKRRKRNNNKPKNQGYCPQTMIKYDKSPSVPKPVWVCKLCLRCLMSENAVRKHILTCNVKKKNQTKEHTSIFDK